MGKPKLPIKRQHISAVEAAEMLQLDRTTIIGMLKRGELQGFKKTLGLTSPYRVYVDSIERVLKERETEK